MQISINELPISLKYTWKISRNTSFEKLNFIITISHNGFIGKGEVAPNIRYNETPESINESFDYFCSIIDNKMSPHEILNQLEAINIQNALKFGIEQAIINWICASENKTLSEFLNINTTRNIFTCYTLPMMQPQEIASFYKKYNLQRFKYIKLKVSATENLNELKELVKVSNQVIFIDGNEAWTNTDDVLRFEELVSNYRIEFIEQPIPAHLTDEYKYLKSKRKIPLIADESCLAKNDFNSLAQQFDGINMKLMKAGGLINGLNIINEAKRNNLRTMVGCMIESTLGLSAAWHLCQITDYADLDGYMIINNEPYQLLIEENGEVKLTVNDELS